MNWITAAVIIFGVMVWLSRKSTPDAGQKHPSAVRPSAVPLAEQISNAVAAGNLAEMARLLGEADTPMERHDLLSALVSAAYAGRSQPDMRKRLYEYGQMYTDSFDEMLPHLQEASEGEPVNSPVFKCLAISMEEDLQFEEAVALCRKALKRGLVDGTKTGFEGRIRRLQRKQASA
jgi:hypothetical protein